MSTIREAHTPKSLEAELKKSDGSIEAAISIYEKQANQALKAGKKDLYENYMHIIEDLRMLKDKGLEKSNVNSGNAPKQKAEKTT
jgi:hypothetical protein